MLKWLPFIGEEVLIRTLLPVLLLACFTGWLLYRIFSGEPLKLATADFLLALLGGLLAARVIDYLIFLPSYLGYGNLIRNWTYLGGCFWPGLAAGLSILWRRAKYRGDDPWLPVATGLLTVPFAMVLVWIGALLDGSAWGTASGVPWALGFGQYGPLVTLVEFGPVALFDPSIPATYAIHPVQAYFALGCLLIGTAGVFLTRRLPPRTFSAVLVGALALLWIGLGYMRADDPVFILSLRIPQIMALGGLAWSAVVMITEKKPARGAGGEAM